MSQKVNHAVQQVKVELEHGWEARKVLEERVSSLEKAKHNAAHDVDHTEHVAVIGGLADVEAETAESLVNSGISTTRPNPTVAFAQFVSPSCLSIFLRTQKRNPKK